MSRFYLLYLQTFSKWARVTSFIRLNDNLERKPELGGAVAVKVSEALFRFLNAGT